VHEAEVRIMDERRRLLERVFSREGAGEPVEEFTDPTTGDVVRMTRSQWLLAEFDRRHGAVAAVDDEQAGAQDASEDDPSTFAGDAETQAPDEAERMPASARARRYRRSLPYLAAACGLVLGIVGTLAVQQALAPTTQGTSDAGGPLAAGPAPTQQASGDDAGSLVSGQSGPSAGSGQGDEGATVAAVSNYFATTPQADDLPPSVTQGFDSTSFRSVAGTIADDATSIYAARRFDGAYCLVAVTRAGRTAETCGTMDDIARRGLSLTEDTIDERYKEPTMVTVTWQTDGTLSWSALPPLG
jgi:hypothetical protein